MRAVSKTLHRFRPQREATNEGIIEQRQRETQTAGHVKTHLFNDLRNTAGTLLGTQNTGTQNYSTGRHGF